ncbi:MAG TPA: type II toxin-antitoxin system RatA family toxin [Steroidobacteraceae bacterium]|nr:type II toxin-antitoxin system RatA family toxin [Steroidobacteraceae bacterium]
MRHIRRSALVAVSPQRMFELINDVESYPQFVPGCSGASVLERDGDSLRARLTVGSGLLRTSFVTRNHLRPPHAIDMELDEGPLRSLTGKWRLVPVAAGSVAGCRVELDLDFEVERGLAGLALGPAIERVAGSLVDAFVARARAVA